MHEGWVWDALKVVGLIGGGLTGSYAINRYVIIPIRKKVGRLRKALEVAYTISRENRIEQVSKALETIESFAKELSPNAGKSMRDQLNRIEQCLATERGARRAMAHVLDVALFEADEAGRFIWVNRRFCEMTGLVDRESLGFGWSTAVDISEREIVVNEWEESIERCRQFHMTAKFRHPRTKVISLGEFEAWPYIDPETHRIIIIHGVLRQDRSAV